jgi:hypothetical protein
MYRGLMTFLCFSILIVMCLLQHQTVTVALQALK